MIGDHSLSSDFVDQPDAVARAFSELRPGLAAFMNLMNASLGAVLIQQELRVLQAAQDRLGKLMQQAV